MCFLEKRCLTAEGSSSSETGGLQEDSVDQMSFKKVAARRIAQETWDGFVSTRSYVINARQRQL